MSESSKIIGILLDMLDKVLKEILELADEVEDAKTKSALFGIGITMKQAYDEVRAILGLENSPLTK